MKKDLKKHIAYSIGIALSSIIGISLISNYHYLSDLFKDKQNTIIVESDNKKYSVKKKTGWLFEKTYIFATPPEITLQIPAPPIGMYAPIPNESRQSNEVKELYEGTSSEINFYKRDHYNDSLDTFLENNDANLNNDELIKAKAKYKELIAEYFKKIYVSRN